MKTNLPPTLIIFGALLVVFVSGGALGSLGTKRFSSEFRAPEPMGSENAHCTPQTWEEKALESFSKSMHLSEAQLAAVAPVFDRASTEVIDKRDEALFEIFQRMLVLHDEVEGYLDLEQQKKLAKSKEKMQLTMKKRFPSLATP